MVHPSTFNAESLGLTHLQPSMRHRESPSAELLLKLNARFPDGPGAGMNTKRAHHTTMKKG